MQNKKIIILSPFFLPNTGGVETHLSDLCSYLEKKKWDIRVITYKPLTTKTEASFIEKKSDRFIIYRIPWFGKTLFHKFEKYPILQFFYLVPGIAFFAFFFLLKNHKEYRIVHAQGFAASFVANALPRFFKLRLISSMHALYGFGKGGYLDSACRWILLRFNKVFCLPDPSQRDLLNAGVPPDILDVYVYWVDQNNFKPMDKETSRDKIKIPQKFTVLFVGRLIEKKGAGLLMEIAQELKDINFVFVGDGPIERDLKQASEAHHNIFVVGRKTPQEIPVYYGSADIGVLPSQYEEGFARVTLEALSCGRPVIVANKGCFPGMINDTVGILVDPTKDNIKEKILFLYKNQEELNRLTGNCRKYATEHFSEKNAERIEDAYLE